MERKFRDAAISKWNLYRDTLYTFSEDQIFEKLKIIAIILSEMKMKEKNNNDNIVV